MDEQSDPRFLVGQVLADRYWLQEHLGRGAMGDVFRARHAKVPRTFAIKVLHPELVADPKVCARFEREAELAGRLHHRNVISVVDVGETARSRYLVMEFAEGISLVDLIAGQPMPATRVIDLAKQICDGLQHAHEHELVHRDLKPENIIVERTGDAEVPRIVDFGLAILHDGVSDEAKERLTTRGIVLGTPHYLAPETALGGTIDHRVDLFALGVILYEMLTGKMPFDGDGVAVARANLHTKTPPMGVRVPGLEVDPLLEALVAKLLEKKPADRPQSAREVRNLLDLIDKDRRQAAFLLGITPRQPSDRTAKEDIVVAPAPAPTSGPSATAEMAAQAALARPTGDGVPLERASSNELTNPTEAEWFQAEGGAVPTKSKRAPTPTAEQRPPSEQRNITTDQVAMNDTRSSVEIEPQQRARKKAIVVGAIAGLLGATLLFLATRGEDTRAPAPPAPVIAHVTEPPVAPPAPEPVVVPAPPEPEIDEEISEEVVEPTPEPTLQARTPNRVGRTPPVTPTAITTPAPAADEVPAPPAKDVIEMYQRLGRKLKSIADRRDMSADDLWVRYRLVRIQDVYQSAGKRAQYVAILTGIEDELARRFPD